jgi:hypothetical protein
MSASVTIKNQIKAKIQTCASVQQVYGYEEVNPTGWPCVMLTPANMTGEFSSSSENSRVYSYRTMILFTLGQDMETPKTLNRLEYAENTISTVIDEIINAIDDNFVLDGTPVLFVNASDVQWGYVAYEGGEARSAEITLNVYTEVTVI